MDEAPVRFGVIGTNWITAALIAAGRTIEGFEVGAVLSRSGESGERFARENDIPEVLTDLHALGAFPDVDAVYVASPNSLHAPQSRALLRAGKHVLCEKPLAATAAQARELMATAQAAGKLLMEAYTSPFEPNVMALVAAVPRVGAIRRVVMLKDQYSSRYDALKAGQLPNAFNPQFAAGSLMDIGLYPVALSRHLFGPPRSVRATGVLLSSGVDGQGTLLLEYDGFEVVCLHSKIAEAGGGSWIAGEAGNLAFDDCSVPTQVVFTARPTVPAKGAEGAEEIAPGQSDHHMRYEVEHFIRLIRSGAQQSDVWPVGNSVDVLAVLDEARAQVGVRFPGD